MPHVYCVFTADGLDGIYSSADKAVSRLEEYGPATQPPSLPGGDAQMPEPAITPNDAKTRLKCGFHVWWSQDLTAIRWSVR